jgi:hypothetical protein
MPPPEWLRPVSERFLAGDPGPPPWTVRLAAVLAGAGALAAAGMVQVWGVMSLDGTHLEVALPLTATGVVLLVVLGSSVVRLRRDGWFRPPLYAGTALGVLALLAALSIGPGLLSGMSPETRQDAGFLTPRFAASAVAGFGLVLVLRTGSASTWLAKQRFQVRAGRGGRAASGGGDAVELDRRG